MAFSEKIKSKVKRLSHQTCCVCKTIGIEIHHIIPQSEKGPDTLDNAAPLCPSCHEIYGQNPTKRKFIRETRDIWYDICEKRYGAYPSKIEEILSKVENIHKMVQQGKNETKYLSLGELIDVFRRTRIVKDDPFYASFEICYALIFKTHGIDTAEEKEFNILRDFFLESFGIFVAEWLIMYLTRELQLDWTKGMTEDKLANFMGVAETNMRIISMYDGLGLVEERIGAYIDKNGQVVYEIIT